MNDLASVEELAGLRRKLVRVAILDAPGFVLIGLAIYGKKGEGPAFHPLLDNPTITTAMLIVGGTIAAWGAFQAISLSKRIAALEFRLKGDQRR